MTSDDVSPIIVGTGTPAVGIRSDVYERRLELIWMSSDDIENFEVRLSDKTLVQNLAIFLLAASIPLLIEKIIDYTGSKAQTDLAVVIVCLVTVFLGLMFQCGAWKRKKKIQTFKQQLFQRESKLSISFHMIDTSSTVAEHKISSVA
jgi:hypothetical protein